MSDTTDDLKIIIDAILHAEPSDPELPYAVQTYFRTRDEWPVYVTGLQTTETVHALRDRRR